jgi:hypothetical protein
VHAASIGCRRSAVRSKPLIALFSIRSLTRSRQHRVAFAFYLAFVFAIALSLLRERIVGRRPAEVCSGLAHVHVHDDDVCGLRSAQRFCAAHFAHRQLGIADHAASPPEKYIAATVDLLLLFAVTASLASVGWFSRSVSGLPARLRRISRFWLCWDGYSPSCA